MFDNDQSMLITKDKNFVTHVLVSYDELRQPYHNCEVLSTGISPLLSDSWMVTSNRLSHGPGAELRLPRLGNPEEREPGTSVASHILEGAWKKSPKGTCFEYHHRKRMPIVKKNPDSQRNDAHVVDLLPVDVAYKPYPPTSESAICSDNMRGNYVQTGGRRKDAHKVNPMAFDKGGRVKKDAWHVGLPFIGYRYGSGKFYFINQNGTYTFGGGAFYTQHQHATARNLAKDYSPRKLAKHAKRSQEHYTVDQMMESIGPTSEQLTSQPIFSETWAANAGIQWPGNRPQVGSVVCVACLFHATTNASINECVLLGWDPRFPVAKHIIESLPRDMFFHENQIFIAELIGNATVPKTAPILG